MQELGNTCNYIAIILVIHSTGGSSMKSDLTSRKAEAPGDDTVGPGSIDPASLKLLE